MGYSDGGEGWQWRVEWYPDEIIIYTFMTELYRCNQPVIGTCITVSVAVRHHNNILFASTSRGKYRSRIPVYNNIMLLLLYDVYLYIVPIYLSTYISTYISLLLFYSFSVFLKVGSHSQQLKYHPLATLKPGFPRAC